MQTRASLNPRPRVSFIVTGYNEQPFIRESVCSALTQRYGNLQVVLSDNASQDDTYRAMCETAAGAPPGVDVVLNRNAENLHLSGNLQRAVDLSDGQILVRGCGDDVFRPERVERTVEYFLWNPGVLACGCRFSTIDADGHVIDPEPEWLRQTEELVDLPPGEVYRRVLTGFGGGGIYGCAAAYRRELFDWFPPLPPGILWDDQILTFRALILGAIGWFPENLVSYRIHGTNSVNAGGGGSGSGARVLEERRAFLCGELLKAIAVWERDLAHARQTGLEVFEKEGLIERLLHQWKENRETIAHWWQMPISGRARLVVKAFRANPLLPRKFMLQRLFPFPAYVFLRELAGRLRRRSGK